MYQNNIFGENIELANLESDCSGNGVRLRLGVEIVIPKRPALESESSHSQLLKLIPSPGFHKCKPPPRKDRVRLFSYPVWLDLINP
jgi:hypothetical protein